MSYNFGVESGNINTKQGFEGKETKMGYYVRYISTDKREITLSLIEDALKQADAAYSLGEAGEIMFGDGLYGQIEINRPGEELFEGEIEELQESIGEGRSNAQKRVRQTLKNAKTIIAVQVLWQGRDTDETLSKLDPLWEWLFANRQGLLQADGEGYYEGSELILEEE